MNTIEAIQETARHFASIGENSPTRCDVRCMINDLTQNNPRIVREGYNQDKAFARVCNLLKTAAIFNN